MPCEGAIWVSFSALPMLVQLTHSRPDVSLLAVVACANTSSAKSSRPRNASLTYPRDESRRAAAPAPCTAACLQTSQRSATTRAKMSGRQGLP